MVYLAFSPMKVSNLRADGKHSSIAPSRRVPIPRPQKYG